MVIKALCFSIQVGWDFAAGKDFKTSLGPGLDSY